MAADQSLRRRRAAQVGFRTMRGTAVLQDLLAELALTLLPRGMTPGRFSEMASTAFVQAAADISRLRNGRVNHSRVAAQTGLTRADVKRLLKQSTFDSARRSPPPVERVIDGWRTDRQFATRPGHPKRLRLSGASGSFTCLVRKYGGDVPHRAILDELRRIGAVIDSNGSVELQESRNLRQRHNFAFLSPVLPALVDVLRIASNKARSNRSPSIQRLCLSAPTELDLAIVRDRCTSSAQSMLEGLAHSLGTVSLPRRGRPPTYSFSVTILLTEDRTKGAQRTP
jgi:Family of unknown function (DUF6502)